MAYSIVWPAALPQKPVMPYSEDGGVLMLRTPMDKGPAKQRRTGAKPDVLSLTYMMTTAQLEAFETFVKDTISGVKRFGFPHPRKTETVEARIVGSDGKLYGLSNVGPRLWHVSFTVEVLP